MPVRASAPADGRTFHLLTRGEVKQNIGRTAVGDGRQQSTPRAAVSSAPGHAGSRNLPGMSTPTSTPRMLTAAEVAALLRVEPRTVRDWCASGELPAYRIGREHRIDHADLQAWLQTRRAS